MRQTLGILILVACTACASKAPPSLSSVGVRIWQANEAVVVIGNVQHAAIGLNGVQKCDAQNHCAPVLSDANTRIVVNTTNAALNTLKSAPAGWKATVGTALTTIAAQMDATGKTTLAAYLTAAHTILDSL